MNVGIVGAGIAGLGAAIALRRGGHNVEVFEKSTFKNEVGAAILLTPNGNRVLRRWDFDFEKAKPVDFKQFRFINAETLKVAVHEDLSKVEEVCGERVCAYHRVDLHSGLRELAEQRGARIRLGAEVVNVEPENGSVVIKCGETVQKDFWVLADGCHCPFLPEIANENLPTVKIGKSVYRWLAPFDKVLEHPDCAKLWDNEGPGFCTFFNDRGLMMVTYPCRGGELLNCAVFHDTRPEESDKEDWNAPTSHKRVLWETAEQVKVYTVTQRPPSNKIYKGKMLCVGDTTHYMLPTHAQGGCSALEDAATLEILFSSSTFASSTPSPFELEKRLGLYQQLRLPRSASTQILSSTNPRLTMEGLAKKTEEIRNFYKGELPDWPLGCTAWSSQLREFFYTYNIFDEAEKIMMFKEEGVAPEGSFRWFGRLGERSEKSEYAGFV